MPSKSALFCLWGERWRLTFAQLALEVKSDQRTHAGTTAETREQPNGQGGVDVEVMVLDKVAQDIQRGGKVFKAMKTATGSSMVPIVR
jgi:hypothetical protein